MSFDPEKDGVEHINVYSRGTTELGRFLTNFYHQSIQTEDGRFESVEGYWGWLGSGAQDRDSYRKLYGFDAKKAMNEEPIKGRIDENDFKRKIKKAIAYKIATNAKMALELKKSTLPFVHYYNYKGKIVVVDDCDWIMEFLENLRKLLKSESCIINQEKSLFEAPIGSIIGQSCNTVGSWGAGIALEFKKLFPESFEKQMNLCKTSSIKIGDYLLSEENGYGVLGIFTSIGFGSRKSSNQEILRGTFTSLSKFLSENPHRELHIPKINTGMFACNWEEVKCVISMLSYFFAKLKVNVYATRNTEVDIPTEAA